MDRLTGLTRHWRCNISRDHSAWLDFNMQVVSSLQRQHIIIYGFVVLTIVTPFRLILLNLLDRLELFSLSAATTPGNGRDVGGKVAVRSRESKQRDKSREETRHGV